jgi:response regulator RpfG family c-di-GMP phosphodiesterase
MRILDKLRDDGRITAAQYESLYHHARRSGEPVQEAILDGNVMTEVDLLKFIAGIYQTRFVSTERLAKAELDREALTLVPRKLAERLFTVPVLYDKRASSLSLVVQDLEEDIAKQVQLVTGAREVRAYIARPASIRAAIRKHYGGDLQAFAGLASPLGAPTANDLQIDRGDLGGLGGGLGGFGGGGGGIPLRNAPAGDLGMELEGLGGGLSGLGAPPPKPAAAPKAPIAPRAAAIDLGKLEMPAFDAPKENAAPTASLVETVSVLVSLVEQNRGELRGHSAMVARICAKMADRLSMSAAEKDALLLAAHLHDLGKHATYHLTAFNVSRFDGHRMTAEKTWNAPIRLFESAHLSPLVVSTLEALHERWDGNGFPKKLAGKDIPLGARVLSVVETYADLVQNTKNPYKRTLTRQEALDVVRQLSSQLFDPSLLDVLRVAGASEGTQGGGVRHRVLIVEPDTAEATVLELRFADQGWDAYAVPGKADAEKALGRERFDLVISEVELGTDDGFSLAPLVRASSKSADAALVYLTKRADRDAVNKGFAAGAADYLQKPTAPDVVVAKAAQIVEGKSATKKKASGGLSGALRDMGLPEVVQVLGQSRKTGQLRITSGNDAGEMHFDAGNIVHAMYGKQKGEAAFYAMLLMKEGDFAFDPNVKTTERTLSASTESLLLEGMRRIDEGIV